MTEREKIELMTGTLRQLMRTTRGRARVTVRKTLALLETSEEIKKAATEKAAKRRSVADEAQDE